MLHDKYIKADPCVIGELLERGPDLVSTIDGRNYVGLVERGQDISDAALEHGKLFFILAEIIDEDDLRLTAGFSDDVAPIAYHNLEAMDIYGQRTH